MSSDRYRFEPEGGPRLREGHSEPPGARRREGDRGQQAGRPGGEHFEPFEPDQWDRSPYGGYRSAERPYPESQADGAAYEGRSGRDRASYARKPRLNGYGELNWVGYEENFGNPVEGLDDRNFSPGFGAFSGSLVVSRGPHTGKGPKGYRRSDERVREDVSDLLERDGALDASEIEVEVNAGEVTLEGMVQDRQSKRRAEDLTEEVPGVKQVHNRLRLSGHGGNKQAVSQELSR